MAFLGVFILSSFRFTDLKWQSGRRLLQELEEIEKWFKAEGFVAFLTGTAAMQEKRDFPLFCTMCGAELTVGGRFCSKRGAARHEPISLVKGGDK